MITRFGIAEWYGRPFLNLRRDDRRRLADAALTTGSIPPPCPFQRNAPPCRKRGGVCSLQRYSKTVGDRVGEPAGEPVIVCPARFDENQVLIEWLAEIAGFEDAMVAREVAFMRGTETGKAAGKIDLVVARLTNGGIRWVGLEIQAVYFSGTGMGSEFQSLRDDDQIFAPWPNAVRRPDWRSSSAKRLMPQLQIKVPTLRRWGSK